MDYEKVNINYEYFTIIILKRKAAFFVINRDRPNNFAIKRLC